jgi:hypothetical protein
MVNSSIISIMPIMPNRSIMSNMPIMETGSISICAKNEFPGKRYNTSNHINNKYF